MLDKLRALYGEKANEVYNEIQKLTNNYSIADKKEFISEKDTVLITYGDFISNNNPLQTLNTFACKYLKAITIIHILPFYPYSSDRGYSVIDYKKVNPNLGDWADIEQLKKNFKLMFDFVLNHMSDKSPWFQEFVKGNYEDFFISYDKIPSQELTKDIVRARTSDLFVKYKTASGDKYLWRSFLNDQIDLNYKNPKVLLAMIDVMLFYVSKGASLLRLDAIAFLWKELGTNCFHLKQTHIIVQLFRDILNKVAPHVVIITETNAPHKDNISYFGNGKNEAQMVYNFTLPPLVLHSFLTGKADKLSKWINSLEKTSDTTTYFNFLDSHDGIGLRPVENILTKKEVKNLIQRTIKNNGLINYRRKHGMEIPYEMNITWWSFLKDNLAQNILIDRYVASRAIALSLNGLPGIYLHGLLGSENDLETVERTGHNRDINRKNLKMDEIEEELQDKESETYQIYNRYMDLIEIRSSHKAFHPNAEQKVLFFNDCVFSLKRRYEKEEIIVLINVTNKEQTVNAQGYDLISEKQFSCVLNPYQVCWLK